MFFLAATNNATQFSCCAFPYRARAVHFAKLSSLFLHIRLLFMGTATLITLFFGELTFWLLLQQQQIQQNQHQQQHQQHKNNSQV